MIISTFSCCQDDIFVYIFRTALHPPAEAHSGISHASKLDFFVICKHVSISVFVIRYVSMIKI